MLGRIRRTTPLDVGLALVFAGLAFLCWSLVAGVSRYLMALAIRTAVPDDAFLPRAVKATELFFVDTGFIIDIVGLAWMALSLILIVLASRQRISISWGWCAAVLQVLIAALGAVWVGLVISWPHSYMAAQNEAGNASALETISQLSLPVIITVAVLIWVVIVFWLLVERSRMNRRGPTLTDGLRQLKR
jgi:hypothetical protein